MGSFDPNTLSPTLTLKSMIFSLIFSFNFAEKLFKTPSEMLLLKCPHITPWQVPPNFASRCQSRELLQFGAYTHSNRVEAFRNPDPNDSLSYKL